VGSVERFVDVRFGSLADIEADLHDVRFPPKADIAERHWDVRFVPEADIAHCNQMTSP
jgi:hypothetical protein